MERPIDIGHQNYAHLVRIVVSRMHVGFIENITFAVMPGEVVAIDDQAALLGVWRAQTQRVTQCKGKGSWCFFSAFPGISAANNAILIDGTWLIKAMVFGANS